MSEQKKEGIGIMAQGGRVYVHFFAVEQAIELTPEEASGFADNLNQVALAAIKQQEVPLVIS